MAQVVLNQVSKWYALSKKEKTLAVKNISLEVGKGEFLVLVGPSGCGKSTTLRMIAGLEDISEGILEIDGRRMNEVEPKDRDIAMVFQNYALYPHMNVYENMAFGLKLRKHSKEEIRKRVFEAAEILGLEGILERLPKALSGGQRQRVAVGRAIVRKPKVFLFDEPLSNLDARMRVQMRLEILRLHKRLSATMIYVTHDQVEAMTMGDRIVVMKDGEIQQAAEPRELYHRPRNRFVADFIGSPAMNFFSGRLASTESGLVFQHAAGASGPGFSTPVDPRFETALEPYRGKELELGIRPEDLALANGRTPSRLGSVFEATVEMVETLGAEALWRLSVDEKSFVIRVPSELETEEGRPVRIEAPSDKCHFFDSQTGLSLSA